MLDLLLLDFIRRIDVGFLLFFLLFGKLVYFISTSK